jgi:outer membrane receptor protein involved in Fe transport
MDIGRRAIEGRDRASNFEHTNYRGVIGARGEFAEAFSYDVYGQYYYTTLSQENTGYLNLQNVENALIATIDPATGQPACVTGGSSCVPWNIFQEGGVTEEQLDYLYASGSQKGDITEQILHGDITVDLGVWDVRSPLAQEGLAFNVGWERRSQKFKFAPDFASLSGLLSGAGGASVSIDERYVVNEQFIEARFPILQDMPGAHYLAFDAGYRRSDYTTIGVVNTHKFQLQYSPIQDVRIRGSYQKAIRAPSLIELFNPQLVGKIAFGEDPCAPSETTGELAATFEECARTGVTQEQYDNRTIPQGTAQQLSQLQGGNPELTEETADSYTVGITFNPSFLPEFSGSLDYFKIKIEDQVGTIPANLIMENCLNTGDPTYCTLIVRSPLTGTLDGATVESGGYIVQTSLNIGEAETSGIDAQAAYRLPIGTMGNLVFSLYGTYLIDNKVTPVAGGGAYDCAGLFGPTCLNVNPEWRHNFRVLWSTPWDVDISLLWRYMSAVKLDNNDSNPLLFGTTYGREVDYHDKIGSYSYFDLYASWRVRDELSVRAGMNNVFDKDPPIVANELVAGGSPNTYEAYDTLGRQWYVGFTAYFGPREDR